MELLGRYLARMRDIYRYNGPAGLLWRVVVKCVSPLGRLELANLYEKDLRQPISVVHPKVEVTLALATPADVDTLAVVTARAYGIAADKIATVAHTIARRMRGGELCFVAKVGREIVHFNWLSFRRKESLAGRWIVLDHDAAYCGGAYTAERWRGLAIHTAVHATMLRYLRAKGFRRAYLWVHADNRSSWITIERVGWDRCGVLLAFTPKGRTQAHIWRITGRLEPFIALGSPEQPA